MIIIIDDIVRGIIGALSYEDTKYEVINLGNNKPISLLKLVEIIELIVGKKAILERIPNQKGDVPITFANIDKARKLLGFNPSMDLKNGIFFFYEWLNSSSNL